MERIVTLEIQTLLISEANARESHWARSSRRKKQREAVRVAWLVAGKPELKPPVSLRLTRVVPKRRFIRDYDNLVSSFKAIIDEVALIAGIDDSSLIWDKEQFMQKEGKDPKCIAEVSSGANIGVDLTQLQFTFFAVLVKVWEERGLPPTQAEMNNLPGVSWHSQQLFGYLTVKGYLERIPGLARGLKLTGKGEDLKRIVKLREICSKIKGVSG